MAPCPRSDIDDMFCVSQYMLDVPNWLSEVQNQGIPDSIEELEEAVARFDDLHAAFNTFYNEVRQEKICF